MRINAIVGCVLLLVLAAVPMRAQANLGIVAGPGIDNSMGRYRGSSQIMFQAGMGWPAKGKLASGGFVEGGYIGPWKDASVGSGVFSANWFGSWLAGKRFAPFMTAGLGCVCGDGFAVNYGAGLDYLLHDYQEGSAPGAAFRVEVRDYFLPTTTPARHYAAVRIGFVGYLDD